MGLVYMLMLIKNLGKEYIVWDKSACISFKKPGRTTLTASFLLDQQEIDTIRKELDHVRHIDRKYLVELTDEQGTVHASIEKVVYIRKRDSGG
jgi:hypothetical protein